MYNKGDNMNELYVANLVKKTKVCEWEFVCKVIGPIVGFLFGTHFLSSHSKKYIPMFIKIHSLEGNQFCEEIDFSKEKFFQSDEEYAYYDLKKVEDYDDLERMIDEYKERYSKVCYFVNFTTRVPTMIRYKQRRRNAEYDK